MKDAVRVWAKRMAIGLAAIGLAGCEPGGNSSPDVGDNDPNVVTVIGDSMTSWGSNPWPSLVASLTGKLVVNRGVGGTRSDYGVGIVGRVLATDKPGYLCIQFGVNDVGRGYNRESIVENLRTMVRAAKANQTIPVVATLAPLYRSHEIFDGEAREVNKLIREMAGREGAEVADLEAAFGSDDTLIGPDGLHPTEAGNERIASVFAGIVD